MHKIAILSDTHGLLRPEVLEAIKDSEVIFHGGDINKQEILDKLESIAPVHVVRGNNDKDWAEHIPETLTETIQGLQFFMIHNIKTTKTDLSAMDIVIYGHTHRYEVRKEGKVTYINPGSCGLRRFHQEITLALILPSIMHDIDGGKTIKQIAKKYHITEELSEQINRMYLTHPGVSVDGIMTRLGK